MPLLLAALPLAAQDLGPLVTDAPVDWNGGQIAIGDAEAAVRRVAQRTPDRAVTLYQNDQAPVGEQWMFIDRQAPQVLWVELIRGRVTRVWVEPLGSADR